MLHHNMLAFTCLPAGIAITTHLCQVSSGKCIEVAKPDGIQRTGAYTRVGSYASDRSYGQFYVGGGPNTAKQNSTLPFGNISVAFTAGEAGIQVMVTPIGCDVVDCEDLTLKLSARFIWMRAGQLQVQPQAVQLQPGGNLPQVSLSTSVTGVVAQNESTSGNLTMSLAQGAIAFSTLNLNPTVARVAAEIEAARQRHRQAMHARFGHAGSGVIEAAFAVEVRYPPPRTI